MTTTMTQAQTSLGERLFVFLTGKYVQSQDARQKEMGLQYMTAETHDLAESIAAALEVSTAPGWVLVPRFLDWSQVCALHHGKREPDADETRAIETRWAAMIAATEGSNE